MKKFYLVLMTLVTFFLCISLTTVQAGVMGPKPVASTDVSKGKYFVKPGGSGTTCSITAPCDIWHGIAKARAGDGVFLRGGTYNINKAINFSYSGTSTAPIIFESYPNEHAILDGGQNAKGAYVRIDITGNYIQLRKLEIRNMPQQGLRITGSNNLFDGLYVHHNILSGLHIISLDDGAVPGKSGSKNIIRNTTASYNSGVGLYDSAFDNGGNSDGISISNGNHNRIENCLIYNNSDDGIDTWRSTYSYVGYNIVFANGAGDGNGNGIKAGGIYPGAYTLAEHNLSYSNRNKGIMSNNGDNVTLRNNTTWNNKSYGYSVNSDTIVSNNIASESLKRYGKGIESDNSWQRSGNVSFVSTDSKSSYFLVPTTNGGFEDIGAYSDMDFGVSYSPDLVVTQVSYANGIFTSTVKNQGAAATPPGVAIGVAYSVDGVYRTWGEYKESLPAGASINIGTKGEPYFISSGSHVINAHVNNKKLVNEINYDNNKLSRSISVP